MHQKKITVTLLAGLAVSAVSGCMAVASPPAPAPSPQSAPTKPAPYVEPQIVQAPAIEALEAAAPPERADTPPSSPSAPQAPRTRRPDRPAAPRTGTATKRRTPPAPRIEPAVPATSSDVCALGQSYGGWQPDSPQARICRQTYGG
ncbi:hypothetical protein [Streptomyces sp. NPDC050738]|uniref:hypothetical protein n=1 Tax=Streptomyces sp. NPDC050738 TaxID=3154744 RepID=UPI00341EFF1B